MNKSLLLFFFISISSIANSQDTFHKTGEFFMHWGWNRGFFTRSDIHFEGNDYGFTLFDVKAKDRPTPFSVRTYLGPTRMTLPQYNFRMGVFINSKYSISLGVDHMKYVMQNYQDVLITGEIKNSGTIYDGSYREDSINLKPDFLLFEHTDGLNYENIELRRNDVLYHRPHIRIEGITGIGAGILLPRTNATLLNNERYDEFHLAGFGLGITGALQINFYEHFYIQFEAKGGYIDMPDIRTTMYKSDKASQHFYFAQFNGVIGVNFNLTRDKKQ